MQTIRRNQNWFLALAVVLLAFAAWLNITPIHSGIIGGGTQIIGGGGGGGGGSGITSVSADTNPSLGGNLNVNGHNVGDAIPADLTKLHGITASAAGLNAAGTVAVTAAIFDVRAYGAYGDGTHDDSTVINTAIAACQTAGGGIVYFPAGTYLCSSKITIPYAASPTWAVAGGQINRMASIRITGDNPDLSSWALGLPPVGGTILQLDYTDSVARLDCRGAGLLEIDHLTLLTTTTDAEPFIQTTNTILRVHDVQFFGYFQGVYNDTPNTAQAAIVFGGAAGRNNYRFTVTAPSVAPAVGDTYTNSTFTFTVERIVNGTHIEASTPLPDAPGASGTLTRTAGAGDATLTYSAFVDEYAISGMAATDWFQGYGSVVEKCAFHKIGKQAFLRYGANSIVFRNNYNDLTCGGNAAIEIAGNQLTTTALRCAGNVIRDNLVEMGNYKYGLVADYCHRNTMDGNQYWDAHPTNTLFFHIYGAHADHNTVFAGYDNGTPAKMCSDAGTDNSMINAANFRVNATAIRGVELAQEDAGSNGPYYKLLVGESLRGYVGWDGGITGSLYLSTAGQSGANAAHPIIIQTDGVSAHRGTVTVGSAYDDVKMLGVPTYANNAAALTASLAAGTLYYNAQNQLAVVTAASPAPTTLSTGDVTAGSLVWAMPNQGGLYKGFWLHLIGCTNTSTVITFPTAFTSATGNPSVSGDAAAIAKCAVTNTTCTVAATSTTSGWVFVEGN